MPRRETAARRYAEAAFEIGRADRTLDRWEKDLEVLRATVAADELRRLIEHPAVPFAEKERVLREVVGRRVSPEALNLVLLMIRRGRPGAVAAMVDRFHELLRRRRGVVLADVRTALPLDDGQRAQIAARLRALVGDQVQVTETVDASLIGGITVRVGDRMWDASVRNRLERLRARLTAV